MEHLAYLASELPLCEIDQVGPRDGDHGDGTQEGEDGDCGGDEGSSVPLKPKM